MRDDSRRFHRQTNPTFASGGQLKLAVTWVTSMLSMTGSMKAHDRVSFQVVIPTSSLVMNKMLMLRVTRGGLSC